MTPPTIDQAVFAELVQITGEEFVAELIDSFLEDAPHMLASLRLALNTQDAETFRRTAHSLKSNAASFGAMALYAQARECEILGLAGLAEQAETSVAVLAQSFDDAATSLKKLRHA